MSGIVVDANIDNEAASRVEDRFRIVEGNEKDDEDAGREKSRVEQF